MRELEGFVERCLGWPSSAREIGTDMVSRHLLTPPSEPAEGALRVRVARLVKSALVECRRNKQLVCRILDISYRTLQSNLARAAGRRTRAG